jgi:hypothetical protein
MTVASSLDTIDRVDTADRLLSHATPACQRRPKTGSDPLSSPPPGDTGVSFQAARDTAQRCRFPYP